MPQGIALFEHFTITETFRYFGKLYGMNSEEILARTNEISESFDLPTQDRIISNLRYPQKSWTFPDIYHDFLGWVPNNQ